MTTIIASPICSTEAEIRNLNRGVICLDKHVLQFEIAITKAFIMKVGHSAQHLPKKPLGDGLTKGAPLAVQKVEQLALLDHQCG